MPIILAIVGLVIAGAIWYRRAQRAKDAAGELIGAANDVRLAARRFGFRAKTNAHPFDQIEDPRLAAAGAASAIASLDGPMTADEITRLVTETRAILNADAKEAADIAAFGRWLAGQTMAPDDAIRQLGRKVKDLAGPEAGPDFIAFCRAVAAASTPATDLQEDAIARLARSFGL